MHRKRGRYLLATLSACAQPAAEFTDHKEKERPTVDFRIIQDRILRRTCQHCHSNPARVGADAGPGNTGGFGYLGNGLDLTSEAGLRNGIIQRQTGKRISIISSLNGATPMIIQVLRARHSEQRGNIVPGILGMPLGFPPVPEEDIRLLESWITAENEK